MKVLNAKELLKLSPSELADYKEKLLAEISSVDNQVKDARMIELNKAGDAIKLFPKEISKILGRNIGFDEFVSMVKATAAGTLGKLANISASTGDRGRRLNDEEKVKLRAELLSWAVAKEMGKARKQLSVIATEFKVTGQTLDTYKPTKEQLATGVKEAKKNEPAPATAGAPA